MEHKSEDSLSAWLTERQHYGSESQSGQGIHAETKSPLARKRRTDMTRSLWSKLPPELVDQIMKALRDSFVLSMNEDRSAETNYTHYFPSLASQASWRWQLIFRPILFRRLTLRTADACRELQEILSSPLSGWLKDHSTPPAERMDFVGSSPSKCYLAQA
ncbi:hypothetical protein PsYK624_149080 [Phanerochaete sordida]|uniref:F-box domain-containing protein n=1 Tax=Phanerochaete sordida TaxID=48140 RepID=A0A9P3GMT0_9APHY|nr:hypothetical protein PsYK624_149080 [Phanerochaete sordida]